MDAADVMTILLTDVRRTTPACVKIVGISSGVELDTAATASPVKYCQLWFEGDTAPQTTAAEYIIVPETHDRKLVSTARRMRSVEQQQQQQ